MLPTGFHEHVPRHAAEAGSSNQREGIDRSSGVRVRLAARHVGDKLGIAPNRPRAAKPLLFAAITDNLIKPFGCVVTRIRQTGGALLDPG